MRTLKELGHRRNLRHLFGLGLCALLFFFAVATKLAAYHTHEEAAKSIAHTKVWQNSGSTPVTPQQVKSFPSAFELLAVILFVVLAQTWYVFADEHEAVELCWFSPSLSVRPPPAL